MNPQALIGRARRASGMSQRALAFASGTSQPTLSAYERGEKSPTLAVADRIVRSSGHRLDLSPRVNFSQCMGARGEPFAVPDRLWRLHVADAMASIALPSHLHWSGPSRRYLLSERRDRARVYEIVLREGRDTDLLAFVDGALLLDLWDELVLPPALRTAWDPLIRRNRCGSM